MTASIRTVHRDTRVSEIAEQFQVNGHSAYPVVDDDGRCIGMISRGDLLREGDWDDNSPVSAVAASDVVTVRPTDTVSDALERMIEEQVDHLPVISDGRLVGICTRTDIMRARRTQFAHEHTEPGWFSRRRRSRATDVAG